MDPQDKNIVKNLIDYYTFLCDSSNIPHGKTEGVKWFKNKTGEWPNVTIGQDFDEFNLEEHVLTIVNEIKNKTLPPFWNLVPDALQEKCANILEDHEFRLINRWTGMSLKWDDYKQTNKKSPSNLVVKPVENKIELKDFNCLINNYIFNSHKIGISLLEPFLYSNQLKMFIAYYKHIPVCTSMTLINDGIAGIYFISTHEDYRGKGFGTTITETAVNYAFQQKANEVVLHASFKGYPIYKKIGFKNYGTYNIFWLMGKQYR